MREIFKIDKKFRGIFFFFLKGARQNTFVLPNKSFSLVKVGLTSQTCFGGKYSNICNFPQNITFSEELSKFVTYVPNIF